MDLISGIKEAIKLKGSGIITAPYFISILYDLQAFAEEGINASAAPNILKAICNDTTVLKIVSGKYPRKLFGFGIKNIISNISRQYGYDKDIISDILKKLLIVDITAIHFQSCQEHYKYFQKHHTIRTTTYQFTASQQETKST